MSSSKDSSIDYTPDRIYSLQEFEDVQTRMNGVVASSQGGFNFGGAIRAPDVSFTPKETYRGLTDQQIYSFQGPAFIPSFVVEVDNLLVGNNETTLTDKFKQIYFPAGIELGWLVDPVNQSFFVFTRDKDGIVHKRRQPWFENGKAATVSGRNVLPGFQLDLWKVDEVSSREDSESESGSESESAEISCPRCDQIFHEDYDFLKHYEDDHAWRRRPTH